MSFIKRGIGAFITSSSSNTTISTRTLLSQLEIKAATAASQDDTKTQLTIAKEIIKVAPTSPKGYLLAGRIHIKLNNLKAALKIYKQGLDQVPNTISGHATLKQNYETVHSVLVTQKMQTQLLQQTDNNKNCRKVTPSSSSNSRWRNDAAVARFSAYNIMCLIFHRLSLTDLIKCTTVCKSWNRLIIKWPPFWQLINAYIPQLDPSSLKNYLSSPTYRSIKFLGQQQQQQQQLEKIPLSIVFSFLATLQEYHQLESLVFENMLINTILPLLHHNSQLYSSLKSVELYSVSFSNNILLGSLVLACHSVERIIFKGASSLSSSSSTTTITTVSINQQNTNNEEAFTVFNISEFSRKAANLCFNISHLEISFGGKQHSPTTAVTCDKSSCDSLGKLINEIIRHCRKLQYLYLDSRDSISHGQIMQIVNESCPAIKDFIINHGCQVPNIVTVFDNKGSSNSNDKTIVSKETTEHGERAGLRRFVMAGGDHCDSIASDQIFSFLKKHQQTIELLYLHHDGHTITPKLLLQLAQPHYRTDKLILTPRKATFPQLRELFLYTQQPLPITAPSFPEALSEYLSCCPKLNALSVVDLSIEPTMSLVTDAVLQSLTLECKELLYLRINGRRSFSTHSLRKLAAASSPSIKSNSKNAPTIDSNDNNNIDDSFVMTLDLNFMDRDLLTVINQWKSLKNVIIRRTLVTTTNGALGHHKKFLSRKDHLEVYKLLEATLRKRGGMFYDYSTNN